MIEVTQRPLISDIAHELIAQIAPRELPMFRPTCEAYFEDPEKIFEAPKDNRLGFGLDTAIAFLTPVVLAVTTGVVKFLAEKVKESLKEASAELVAKLVKKMFNGRPLPAEGDKNKPLALSHEELAQLRQLMVEMAKRLRLSKDQTELLVSAVVGRLAIADT